MKNDTWVTFPVPTEQMCLGDNVIEVNLRKLNPQMSEEPVLTGMEILVEYHRRLAENRG